MRSGASIPQPGARGNVPPPLLTGLEIVSGLSTGFGAEDGQHTFGSLPVYPHWLLLRKLIICGLFDCVCNKFKRTPQVLIGWHKPLRLSGVKHD